MSGVGNPIEALFTQAGSGAAGSQAQTNVLLQLLKRIADSLAGSSILSSSTIVLLSLSTSLSTADSIATTNGGILVIDKNVSLTGNTTLHASVVVGAGGIIATNGHVLTVNGIVGSTGKVFDVSGGGSVTLNAGHTVDVAWWTGAADNASLDYSVGWNAAMATAAGYARTPQGPRRIVAPSGVHYLQSAISLTSPFECVLDVPGVTFQQQTDNTPIFHLNATAATFPTFFNIRGPFNLTWLNLQPAANTLAIGFYLDNALAGQGAPFFIAERFTVAKGFRGIATNNGGATFDSCWNCRISDISETTAFGLSGSIVYLNPPTGGLPSIEIRNVLSQSTRRTEFDLQIFTAQAVIVENWNRGSSGTSSTGANQMMFFSGCHNVKVKNCRDEGSVYSAAATWMTGSALVVFGGCFDAEVNGFDFLNNTVSNAGASLVLVKVTGTGAPNKHVIRGITGVGTTHQNGCVNYICWPDAASPTISRIILKGSQYWDGAGTTFNFSTFQQQLQLDEVKWYGPFYLNNIQAAGAGTEWNSNAQSAMPAGFFMPRPGRLLALRVNLDAAVTGAGNIGVNVRITNGGGDTNATTLTMVTADGLSKDEYFPVYARDLFATPDGSAFPIALDDRIRVFLNAQTVTNVALNGEAWVAVQHD